MSLFALLLAMERFCSIRRRLCLGRFQWLISSSILQGLVHPYQVLLDTGDGYTEDRPAVQEEGTLP